MNRRQEVVVRILLLVARLLAEEPWSKEIKDLANHISVYIKDLSIPSH